MNKVIRFIPLILFVLLAVVLYRGLSLNPEKLPSALIGKPMPVFTLTKLKDQNTMLTAQDLTGDIVLVNVWATWCPSCRYEHPYLLDLAKSDRIKLYGLNYKDERDLAVQWLNQLGDPYEFSIFDEMGRLGLDLGVYAAPETFVIDHQGIIRKRFAGPIDAKVWQEEFEPLISQIEAEKAKG
ncbi:thiol:disulfide interchange protein [Thalassotalea loyana]|uniref:Thiol:disulfide interchange protein n=1 Tax=Thalassotalea loyana TaxID=280483 RepID=A0ABQ6HEA5_9GAMM|nr:DsbE family thiol:disulfide interchange protein [Thalassotalea loyana]GLX85869.1 thiol:disulfide interchange protein [Thalassotalea loyana]